MNDVFVLVEEHPYQPSPSLWLDQDPRVLVMGVDDPTALAEWVRRHDVDGAILVHRSRVGRQARLMANLATGALSSIPVALVSHRVSALAAALACQAVAPLRGPLASKVEWLEQMLATTSSGVVLRSVAGLSDPNPGVVRHMLSLLPWGAPFVVGFTPESGFARLPKSDSLFEAGAGSWHVTEGECPLPVPLRSASIERPVINVRAEYGSRGQEFALLGWPAGDRGPAGDCPVCGTECVSKVCPVCHVHVLAKESIA